MPTALRQQKYPFGSLRTDSHWSVKGLQFASQFKPAGVLIDETANKNDGTLVNSPTWVGQGLDFNGSSQHVTLPVGVIPTPPYTILVWFRLDTLASVQGDACLVGISDNDTQNFILLRIDTTDDKIDFSVRQGGGTTRIATTTNTVPAGVWGMAATVAHSTSSRDVYYNATGKGSNADEADPTGLDTILIGARDLGTPSNHVDGQIGQVLFYGRDLSFSELQEFYRNPDLAFQQYPAWWGKAPVVTAGLSGIYYRTLLQGVS